MPPTTERRGSPRQKSFLRGVVYFDNRRQAFDCLVRDISATGARLIFSDSVVTPDVVDLHVPQKDQTFRAYVQWRHGTEAGVAFAAAAQVTGEAGLAERVQKLEVEIATLKRLLKKLRSETDADFDAA